VLAGFAWSYYRSKLGGQGDLGTHYTELSSRGPLRRRPAVLWTISIILVILWLLGLIGGVGGAVIHLLLLIAAIVLILNLLGGRNAVV
jgi:hypothetical protein